MRVLLLLFIGFSQFLNGQIFNTFRVHSHNDYLQEKPFGEAYEAGVHSLEIDVFLKAGRLYVTHEESTIHNKEDIESMYLLPLQKEARSNTLREVQLLIDIKSDAEATLLQIVAVLRKYPELVNDDKISFVISGNRPPTSNYMDYPDHIRFDYQSLNDLDNPEIWDKIALISLPFYRHSRWNGATEIPKADKKTIKAVIEKAHTFDKPFRFWATPDTELAWKTFVQLGQDFINTDQPTKCVAYLKTIKKEHH